MRQGRIAISYHGIIAQSLKKFIRTRPWKSFASCCLLLLHLNLHAAEVKTLSVGSPLHSPPFVYEGEGRGIELDIVTSILKKMGYTITWRHLPPKRIRHQVQQHEINIGLRTKPLADDHLYYSHPYIILQNVAVTADTNIRLSAISDLSRYNVVAFQNAKEFLGPEFAKSVSNCSVYLELPNQAKQIETLFRRRSQVIVLDKRIFSYFRDMFYPKSEVKIFEIFPPSPYSAVFYDKKLRDEFDRVLMTSTNIFGG